MRTLTYQLGLSLTLLLAWLGLGSHAQAAFIVRVNGGIEAEMGMSEAEFGLENDSAVDASKDRLPETPEHVDRPLNFDFLWWSALAHNTNGCGSTAASPNVSGSVPFATAFSSMVNRSSSQLVRWLYFEDVHYWPPPFASRLFRPPRWI